MINTGIMKITLSGFLILISLAACNVKDQPSDSREITYDFTDGPQGWTGMFSDYPQGEEDFYELEFKWSGLPEPLDTNQMAVKLSGNNHSDDLFSYMFTRVRQLIPTTTYQVTFEIELASNVATNSVGIGGSPDLALGAGGIAYQPGDTIDDSGWHRPIFNVALQSGQSNDVMQVLGTLGVTDTTTVYTLTDRNNIDEPINLTTNEFGDLYLLIGFDSGFEGKTTIYFKTVTVKLKYWN